MPIWWPSAAMRQIKSSLPSTCRPMTKKVATTPRSARPSSRGPVVLYRGPSSKVRATYLGFSASTWASPTVSTASGCRTWPQPEAPSASPSASRPQYIRFISPHPFPVVLPSMPRERRKLSGDQAGFRENGSFRLSSTPPAGPPPCRSSGYRRSGRSCGGWCRRSAGSPGR